MQPPGIALFETAIGSCGVAWNEAGLLGVHLPQASAAKTYAGLSRRHPGAVQADPPPSVRRAIEAMIALLAGEPRDLAEIVLDMSAVGPFEADVYRVARVIPPGSTSTYGEVAARLGDPGAARAVGQALGRNPWPIVVPCHRVLGADGKVGGFSAPGGVETKLRMLTIERARVGEEPSLFDDLPLAAKASVRPGRA